MSEKIRPDDGEVFSFNIETPYFQALLSAPVPILIVCDDGHILMINRAFQSATGLAHQEIPTMDLWAEHFSMSSTDGTEKHFNSLFEPEKRRKPLYISLKTPNGQMLTWDLFISSLGLTTDDRRMFIIIASDATQTVEREQHLESVMSRLETEVSRRTKALNATISALESEVAERKRMSDTLTLSRERLKKMSRRTLDVLEADRRTISKELHDSIGVSLAAIKFSLEGKEMKRQQNHDRLDESLDQEIAYLLATIKETKRISANLRPTTMDDLGLMATIQWYLRQFQRLYRNIRVDYNTEIAEEDVPEVVKIIIYRIIQEGLSNAEKHSEAVSVRLQLVYSDENRSISLFIEDDGRGFDVREALSEKDPLSGYGLTAMRERCEIFGGSFNIDSQIGKGTRIKAILPI
ncbi:MAG: PAS domain S-box protein [Desulfobacterales bacterium]|nr:PAS domain S-box protein [Desulfobacterales bacterium]